MRWPVIVPTGIARGRPNHLQVLSAQPGAPDPARTHSLAPTEKSFSPCACPMPQSGGSELHWRRLVWRHEPSMVKPRRKSLGHGTKSAQVMAGQQSASDAGRPAARQAGTAAAPGLGGAVAAYRADPSLAVILAVCVCGVRARAEAAAPGHGATLAKAMVNTRTACRLEKTWKPPTLATRWANR